MIWKYLAIALMVSSAVLLHASTNARSTALPAREPLTAYSGHYPFDRLRSGTTFLMDPRVKSAVDLSAPDEVIAFAVRQGGVAGPISLIQRHLVATGCQPHNCSDHAWMIILDIYSKEAVLCYYNANLTDASARWFRKGEKISGPTNCNEVSAALMISNG